MIPILYPCFGDLQRAQRWGFWLFFDIMYGGVSVRMNGIVGVLEKVLFKYLISPEIWAFVADAESIGEKKKVNIVHHRINIMLTRYFNLIPTTWYTAFEMRLFGWLYLSRHNPCLLYNINHVSWRKNTREAVQKFSEKNLWTSGSDSA
jgi:hypothetical protein